MTSPQIRKLCVPIESLIEGITMPVVNNSKAISESPIYCIPAEKRIVFNNDLLDNINILEKPELLMFVVLHEIQHMTDNSLMAEHRFDKQSLETMIELNIDITQINPDDYELLLNPTDNTRVARINQLKHYQKIVKNGNQH